MGLGKASRVPGIPTTISPIQPGNGLVLHHPELSRANFQLSRAPGWNMRMGVRQHNHEHPGGTGAWCLRGQHWVLSSPPPLSLGTLPPSSDPWRQGEEKAALPHNIRVLLGNVLTLTGGSGHRALSRCVGHLPTRTSGPRPSHLPGGPRLAGAVARTLV